MTSAGRTAPMPIPQIQGSGSLSPYQGKRVTTTGVVTAVQRSGSDLGFFLQDPTGDGDASTSDALFVSADKLGADALKDLRTGTRLTVSGPVSERHGMTSIVPGSRGLKLDAGAAVEALPSPARLELPAKEGPRTAYLEARESMLSTLGNAMAMGPSNRYSVYSAVDADSHGVARDYGADKDPTHLKISGRLGYRPDVATGDRLEGVHGPLAYVYGDFELQQSRHYQRIERGMRPPQRWGDLDGNDRVTSSDVGAIKALVGTPASGPLDPADLTGDGKVSRADVRQAEQRARQAAAAAHTPSFTLATMNAKDFFDTVDAPRPIDDEVPTRNEYEKKLTRLASAIRDKLRLPDMLALQEVENTKVLEDLIARPELRSSGYQFALLPTSGKRSINPALLYRADRVSLTGVRQAQQMVDADKVPLSAHAGGETGPLFAREPLIVDATVTSGEHRQDMTVIVNHLISKFSPNGAPTEPIRTEQAKFLNKLVRQLSTDNPGRGIVVTGDLNDTPESKPLRALRGPTRKPALIDLMAEHVPPAERYSYNYQGQHQLIDHMLATPALAQQVLEAGVRHFNADFPEDLTYGTAPYRATDHDTPWVRFGFGAGAAADAAAAAVAVQPPAAS